MDRGEKVTEKKSLNSKQWTNAISTPVVFFKEFLQAEGKAIENQGYLLAVTGIIDT
jgi:hypothetical protein